MFTNARNEILDRLKAAPQKKPPAKPFLPPLKALSWDRDQMIAEFTQELASHSGVVHRVKDKYEAVAKLTSITAAEGLTKIIASTDNVIAALDLRTWGQKNGLEVAFPDDFNDRETFKNAVFSEADAGITGADFAVAESGTLILCHDKSQPRLISLAPIFHIALVPLERLVRVYENATDSLFGSDAKPPRHITFITGPSMTADIQATPFRGMHGPKRLEVILIG